MGNIFLIGFVDMNKIPDKIYLQWGDPDEELGVTWLDEKINEDDIEYIRADIVELERKGLQEEIDYWIELSTWYQK